MLQQFLAQTTPSHLVFVSTARSVEVDKGTDIYEFYRFACFISEDDKLPEKISVLLVK